MLIDGTYVTAAYKKHVNSKTNFISIANGLHIPIKLRYKYLLSFSPDFNNFNTKWWLHNSVPYLNRLVFTAKVLPVEKMNLWYLKGMCRQVELNAKIFLFFFISSYLLLQFVNVKIQRKAN
jgi:hypothetical protein